MALTEFDPNDPYGYSYDANAAAIKRRQALAEALKPGALQGATQAGRRFLAPTTNAQMYGNILQNVIAAYAGGTANNEADANEKSRKAQLDAYFTMDPDKAAAEARAKYEADNPYVKFADRPAGYTPGGHDDPDRPDKGWSVPTPDAPAPIAQATPAPQASVLPRANAAAANGANNQRGANMAAVRATDNAIPIVAGAPDYTNNRGSWKVVEIDDPSKRSVFMPTPATGWPKMQVWRNEKTGEERPLNSPPEAVSSGGATGTWGAPGAPATASVAQPRSAAAPASTATTQSRPAILPPPGGPQAAPVAAPAAPAAAQAAPGDAGAELEKYYQNDYRAKVLMAAQAAQARAVGDKERLFQSLSTNDQDRILKRAALAQKEGFSLKPGEVRYDGNGRPIAALPDNTRQGKTTGTITGADGRVYQTWDDGRAPTPVGLTDPKIAQAQDEKVKKAEGTLQQIQYNMKKVDEFLPIAGDGTGIVGAVSNFAGKLFNTGTDSRIANEQLNSLKGMLLASAMALTKEQSGTAAGLSQQESQALQASIASLDMSIGKEELVRQLMNVRGMLSDTHARVQGELRGGGQASASNQGGGQTQGGNTSPSGFSFAPRGGQ